MEEKALDRDDISETSTVLAKSRSTLRRALQRERAASGRTNIEPKSKDAAVHCDLINSTAVTNLQAKLNRERLKLVAMKGKLASARRAFGLHSDSDHSSDSDMSSQADFGDSDQKTNSAEEHTGDEQPDSDEDSSLNNNIEIGDVAQITGLVSDTGVQLNERYGKVISYDPANGRFGIRLIDNRTVAIRAENLAVGMKGDELSDEDENLLLGLQPTAEEIQKLPYLERMRALDSDKV